MTLMRHVTAEAHVAGAIHVAHAAGAERGDDFVLCETSTGGRGT